MAEVVLDRIGKVYPDGTRALDGLDLHVHDGEFLVLVGPSGCGKTTALRMIAGLEEISEGFVRIGSRVVNRVPSRDRDVAMVFQSWALYPHLDVFDNIGFGLTLRRLPRSEIEQRVGVAAGAFGLAEHLRRRPAALSGGQRQRVAMGRAMVRQPAAFLMDEPLSNLDAKLRVEMRTEIARSARRRQATTIYVTHDQTEAMTLGDRVAVLKRGVLQQVATPRELYERPRNMFVAGFIGSPAMNVVRGVLTDRDGPLRLMIGDQCLPVCAELAAKRPNLRTLLYRPVAVGIRPENLHDATVAVPDGSSAGAVLRATVDRTEALGSDLLVHFTLRAGPVRTDDTRDTGRTIPTGAVRAPDSARNDAPFVARFGSQSRVTEGDPVQVRVDTARLHLFDLATGESIW